jgi:hypothetical protein
MNRSEEVAILKAWGKGLEAENNRLRKQIEGHCARISAQSELLSKRAEKRVPPEWIEAAEELMDYARELDRWSQEERYGEVIDDAPRPIVEMAKLIAATKGETE